MGGGPSFRGKMALCRDVGSFPSTSSLRVVWGSFLNNQQGCSEDRIGWRCSNLPWGRIPFRLEYVRFFFWANLLGSQWHKRSGGVHTTPSSCHSSVASPLLLHQTARPFCLNISAWEGQPVRADSWAVVFSHGDWWASLPSFVWHPYLRDLTFQWMKS